ncbi:hypothetical protein D3C72_2172000 [compost metagenome]
MATLTAGTIDLLHHDFLLLAQLRRVLWMAKHQTLDHMLTRPIDQLRADIAMLEGQRAGPRQLDRTPNPPATAGHIIEHALTKCAVTQQPRLPSQPR